MHPESLEEVGPLVEHVYEVRRVLQVTLVPGERPGENGSVPSMNFNHLVELV